MNRSSRLSEQDNTLYRFFRELAAISQSSERLIERALPHELKQPHFNALDFLARSKGPVTLRELALALNVTRGAVANTVRRLEQRGYVSVTEDGQRKRLKRVGLTARGRAAHRTALDALMPQLLELAKTVSAPDMIETLPLLERIRVYLDTGPGRPG